MKRKANKSGISLIVLVITIIVMIILATAIILSLSNSGIIGSANEASFKTDVKAIQSELSVKLSEAILEDEEDTLEGVAAEDVLESAVKHSGKFVISNQKLMYNGSEVTADEKVYLEQIGIEEYWDNSQAYLFEINEDGVLTGLSEEYTDEITEIVIPMGVTSIGACVFEEYGYITSVKIPTGVTSIGECAFDICENLVNINIPNTVESIGDSAFMGCTSLTSVTIPSTTRISIGNHAFAGCNNLTSVSIPSAVASIGEEAFYELPKLTSVTIPTGVTSIGKRAFNDCRQLSNVIISEGLTSISEMAFYGCVNLKNIIIPDGVTRIELQAFCGTGLTSITLPESLTIIASYAFADESTGEPAEVENVYYKGSEANWGNITGRNNIKPKSLHYNAQ